MIHKRAKNEWSGRGHPSGWGNKRNGREMGMPMEITLQGE